MRQSCFQTELLFPVKLFCAAKQCKDHKWTLKFLSKENSWQNQNVELNFLFLLFCCFFFLTLHDLEQWHKQTVKRVLLTLHYGSSSFHVLSSHYLFFLFVSADVAFITTVTFLWKVSAITVVSCLPLYILKYLKRKFSPPSYSKLTS